MYHNSRNLNYKNPYGALMTESEVTVSLCVQDETGVKECNVHYAYGLYTFNRGRVRMIESDQGDYRYTCRIHLPSEAGLFFYWFEVVTETGPKFYTCDSQANNGSGKVTFVPPKIEPTLDVSHLPFQITVYDKEFKTPDWVKGSVIYQIFPDRFYKDRQFNAQKALRLNEYPERIYHVNWDTEVDYKGKEETGYIACDFFGGTLRGISEKLPYLAALGIQIIYLNPIFQSRSNHRYDTGHYEHIDPILGSDDDFLELCRHARHHQIRIILDGVFSHTGSDSLYFNKYGRYGGIGAYQEAEGKGISPYHSWYNFSIHHGNIAYDSWWGVEDLPAVNEYDLNYREYILGQNGIVRQWLRKGASGWRLDVSDELPDPFIRQLRKAVKQENPDALILGEVWEDASHKISYGHFRDFLLGNTHDAVMGYPFRDALIDWLCRDITTHEFINRLESVRENYPPQAYYCNMNLISSHDIVRAITALSGERGVDMRADQAVKKLNETQRKDGIRLLKLAMLVQMTFPGCPSVYYGDEIGMEGYQDPFNRRPFQWGEVDFNDNSLLKWVCSLIGYRNRHPVFRTGYIEYLDMDESVLSFKRYYINDTDAFGRTVPPDQEQFILVNANPIPKVINMDNKSFKLEGFSGMIFSSGEKTFEA